MGWETLRASKSRNAKRIYEPYNLFMYYHQYREITDIMLAMLYCPPFGCGCESATRTLAILSSRQNFSPTKSSHGSFNVDICNNQSVPLLVQCSTILDDADGAPLNTIVVPKFNLLILHGPPTVHSRPMRLAPQPQDALPPNPPPLLPPPHPRPMRRRILQTPQYR